MTRKRVLIVHPYVHPSGGGNAVAAWSLEALRESCELSLATLGPVDYGAVNRSFGTSLAAGDFELHVAPEPYQRLLRWMPTPGALLQCCLVMRLAQDLDQRNSYDVLFSTQNEADFGRRGLQYIHHPWVYLPRPDGEMRWFHRVPGILGTYRWLCQRVARVSNEGLRRNVSLANSRYIAERYRQTHGAPAAVLYPPVPGEFPDVDWARRIPGFVAVGRIHGSKRWELAVGILDQGVHKCLGICASMPDDFIADWRAKQCRHKIPFRIGMTSEHHISLFSSFALLGPMNGNHCFDDIIDINPQWIAASVFGGI